jgi:Ca2+-binding EF-hand superfamily protein
MVNGISSFSSASISEMRQKMFNKIDTNSDGSIDKTEMGALLQQNTSQDTSSLVDKIFTDQDTNQDGLISQIESESSLAKLEQEMTSGGGRSAMSGMPPPPEKVFDTADTNKDGFVSKDELSAVMGKNGENIDKLFSKVDTDGDGLISRTEDETFRKQMTERMQQNESAASGVSGMPPSPEKIFDTADTNKDGFVSKDELAAVMGKNGENIDKLFSKVDTDGDGLISRTEDETFRKQMTERMQQSESADSGTSDISSFSQSWQSKMFDALLKGLTAATGSSGESTSLYA